MKQEYAKSDQFLIILVLFFNRLKGELYLDLYHELTQDDREVSYSVTLRVYIWKCMSLRIRRVAGFLQSVVELH